MEINDLLQLPFGSRLKLTQERFGSPAWLWAAHIQFQEVAVAPHGTHSSAKHGLGYFCCLPRPSESKTSLPEAFPTRKHSHTNSAGSPERDQGFFHSPKQTFNQEILAQPRLINLLFYKVSNEISKLTQIQCTNSNEIPKLMQTKCTDSQHVQINSCNYHSHFMDVHRTFCIQILITMLCNKIQEQRYIYK